MTRKSGRLSKLERIALEHFEAGGRQCPAGIGVRTIANLQLKKWIVWGRDVVDGPEVYAITQLGLERLARDRDHDAEKPPDTRVRTG